MIELVHSSRDSLRASTPQQQEVANIFVLFLQKVRTTLISLNLEQRAFISQRFQVGHSSKHSSDDAFLRRGNRSIFSFSSCLHLPCIQAPVFASYPFAVLSSPLPSWLLPSVICCGTLLKKNKFVRGKSSPPSDLPVVNFVQTTLILYWRSLLAHSSGTRRLTLAVPAQYGERL